MVSATVGGAKYGVVLLWGVALGAFFKFVLTEGIARWQLATGTTVVEGWAEHLPAWVNVYFGAYLVVWTVAVSAALTNATGLGIANLTGGAISQPWGAVAHSLFGFAFVWFGGYNGFEKLMKTLVGDHGLQHPDVRDPDAARSGCRRCAGWWCRRFPPAAAPMSCRSSAASAARSRCCPTTTGCARRR